MMEKMSKIEKILCATCLASGIAIATAQDGQFNAYDFVPYITGILSSGTLLFLTPYKIFCTPRSSYTRNAPEVRD